MPARPRPGTPRGEPAPRTLTGLAPAVGVVGGIHGIGGGSCGTGGLTGGYLGARLQSRLPDRALRLLLRALAAAVGMLYAVQSPA